MKKSHKILILLSLIIVVTFISKDIIAPTINNHETTMIKELHFDQKKLLDIVELQQKMGPRFPTSPGHEEIQNYLVAQTEEYTDDVIKQKWTYESTDGKTYDLMNVIGRINPGAETRILLGAHYDSKRFANYDQKNPKEPVPGANDSASGVAVLLELARVISSQEIKPNIGIDVVFFDAEEGEENIGPEDHRWKPIGSTYFAENIYDIYPNGKPETAIIVDMVADKDLTLYKDKFSLMYAKQATDIIWKIGQEVDKKVFINAAKYGVIDDHAPLNAIGIPSLVIIDFDYDYFHTTDDTVDKCSGESMAVVAETLFRYLYARIKPYSRVKL